MGAMEMKLHCQCTMVGSVTNPSERGLKHGGDWAVWSLNKLEILHEDNGYCWHSVNLCSVHHWRWPCIAENSIWSVLGIWRKSQCVLLGFEALGVLGNTSRKKMFSFGHCPNEGGGRALPELKNTLYIFLFDGRKRCTSCPKKGEGGGRGNSGNARKKTFFYRRCSLIANSASSKKICVFPMQLRPPFWEWENTAFFCNE